MASRTSLVFAKFAVVLAGGGFASLAWKEPANAAYASLQTALGQPVTELFPLWGSIVAILAGFGFGFLAYLTRE